MTDSMIERVSIALAGGADMWSQIFREELREEYRSDARAAIEAMRKPTEAMELAVHGDSEHALWAWQTMIDAALDVIEA